MDIGLLLMIILGKKKTLFEEIQVKF